MSKQNAYRRKQRELFLLERFVDAAKLQAVLVEEREVPDFVIRVHGKHIGVEVTELFISHERGGNTLQAQESISSRIVSVAQEMYQASGAPPARVTVCFRPGSDLSKLGRGQTATALANLIQRFNLPELQSIDCFPNETDLLPYEVSFIHALRVPSFDMARWVVAGAGWVVPLAAAHLQARVDEKAKRLSAYNDAIAENWLLVIADAVRPSQLIAAKDDFDPRGVSSPFDRTFFYRHPDNVVIELGV